MQGLTKELEYTTAYGRNFLLVHFNIFNTMKCSKYNEIVMHFCHSQNVTNRIGINSFNILCTKEFGYISN